MKKGLLGLLTGTVLGGLAAMFTSKRSGKELRGDVVKAWKSGETGSKVVMKELQDIAGEAKKGLEELKESEYGQMAQKELKKAYRNVSSNVAHFVDEAKKDIETLTKEAKKGIATKKKEIITKVQEAGKADTKKAKSKAKKVAAKKSVPTKKAPTKAKVAVKKTTKKASAKKK